MRTWALMIAVNSAMMGLDSAVSTDTWLIVTNLLVTVASLLVAGVSFAVYAATLRAISKDERDLVRDIVHHPISRKHRKMRADISRKIGD